MRSFGSIANKLSILVPKIPTVNSEFCKSLAEIDFDVPQNGSTVTETHIGETLEEMNPIVSLVLIDGSFPNLRLAS